MLCWLDLFAQSLQRFPLQAKFPSQPRRPLENRFPEPILHGGSFATKMHAPDTATAQQLVCHIQQREGMRHAAIHHQAAPRFFFPVVHTHHFMALAIEMLDRSRTEQPAAAGDKNFHPFESIPLPMGGKSKKRAGIAADRIPVMAEIGYERAALSLEEYQQSSSFLTAPR
jgi:hypothetical protein